MATNQSGAMKTLLVVTAAFGAQNHSDSAPVDTAAKIYDAPRFGTEQPVPILSVERLPAKKHRPCMSFIGASACGIEWDEWMMVDALVRPEDAVIEFGARFGTTSCRLASATRNSGRVVSVDPDRNILRYLLPNRQKHRCSFTILSGTVSDVPLGMQVHTNYGSRASPVSTKGGRVAGNIAFRAMEERIGAKFNVALIDCEGCIAHVADAPGDLLGQVGLVLIEEDHSCPNCTRDSREDSLGRVGYAYWHRQLWQRGFENIWHSRDTFNRKLEWSSNLVHTAWRRPSVAAVVDECQAHAARTGRDKTEIDCLPLLRRGEARRSR